MNDTQPDSIVIPEEYSDLLATDGRLWYIRKVVAPIADTKRAIMYYMEYVTEKHRQVAFLPLIFYLVDRYFDSHPTSFYPTLQAKIDEFRSHLSRYRRLLDTIEAKMKARKPDHYRLPSVVEPL